MPLLIKCTHTSFKNTSYLRLAAFLVCGFFDALQREQQPGQLYLAAAKAAIERRKVAAFIAGMHGGKTPATPGRVS